LLYSFQSHGYQNINKILLVYLSYIDMVVYVKIKIKVVNMTKDAELLIAVIDGNIRQVGELLGPDVTPGVIFEALASAARRGRKDIVDLFIKRKDLPTCGINGVTRAINIAVSNMNIKLIISLINDYKLSNNDLIKLLGQAIVSGKRENVITLMGVNKFKEIIGDITEGKVNDWLEVSIIKGNVDMLEYLAENERFAGKIKKIHPLYLQGLIQLAEDKMPRERWLLAFFEEAQN
jgi:hypothetical protein